MTTKKRATTPPRRSTRTSTRRSPRWYPTRRRSKPGLPTTIGAAIGTLAVTTLLDASWAVRLGLVALVALLGLGYVYWRQRAEREDTSP